MPRGVRREIIVPTDPVVLAYLAGIVDGEGHIRVHSQLQRKARSPCHHVELSIINTSEALMAWLLREIGGFVDTRKRAQPHHKDCMRWLVTGTNAETLLKVLSDFLVIKKPHADLVSEFVKIGKHEWSGRKLDPRVVEERAGVKAKLMLLSHRGQR